MTEPTPSPVAQELVPLTISFWDAQIRTVLGLASEVQQEYVSKERLRKIAQVCIVQLLAVFESAKMDELQQPPAPEVESHILTLDKRLVVPE